MNLLQALVHCCTVHRMVSLLSAAIISCRDARTDMQQRACNLQIGVQCVSHITENTIYNLCPSACYLKQESSQTRQTEHTMLQSAAIDKQQAVQICTAPQNIYCGTCERFVRCRPQIPCFPLLEKLTVGMHRYRWSAYVLHSCASAEASACHLTVLTSAVADSVADCGC